MRKFGLCFLRGRDVKIHIVVNPIRVGKIIGEHSHQRDGKARAFLHVSDKTAGEGLGAGNDIRLKFLKKELEFWRVKAMNQVAKSLGAFDDTWVVIEIPPDFWAGAYQPKIRFFNDPFQNGVGLTEGIDVQDGRLR